MKSNVRDQWAEYENSILFLSALAGFIVSWLIWGQ